MQQPSQTSDLPETSYVDVAGSRQPVPKMHLQPGPQYDDANRCFGIASSIARTPGGRLWCGFSSGGLKESHLNYGIVVYSDDDGRSWTSPYLVLDTDGDGPIRTDHITLWTAPTGVLWLLFSQYPEKLCGHHSSQWAITCANPDAEQPRCSAPRKLADEQNLLTTPTVLTDGTWMFPTGCWIVDDDDHQASRIKHPSRPLISCDGGHSFTLGGPLHSAASPDFDEYMIVECRNGRLVAFNRHPSSFLQCESRDQGQTWTAQHPNGLPHTNSRFVFMKLHSGCWLLVKHGTLDWVSPDTLGDGTRGRSHLTAYISSDEGLSWHGGLLLDARDCSYPFGCQAENGAIYLSYERQRWRQPEILLARFTEADVRAGQLVSEHAALRLLVNNNKAAGGSGFPG